MQTAFTPLGLVDKTAVMGKSGESKGDTLEHPTTLLEYDFFNFIDNGDPVWVKTIRREEHYYDNASSPTITSVEYSDGFGRLIQTRTQAEDVIFGDQVFGSSGLPADQSDPNADAIGVERDPMAPLNVTVSGWQVYNNKGKVVEKYEPFFASGFDYIPPTEAETGMKVKMFYDPRGQLIRTVNPDGTEQWVIFGSVPQIENPYVYFPTPWESYTYDADDLADLTKPGAVADSFSDCWWTPSSSELDALGRTIKTIDRNGITSGDEIVMQYTFDVRGNLLTVTDALAPSLARACSSWPVM